MMKGGAWIVSALLAGILIIFALGILHITLYSMGLWSKVPNGITRAVDSLTVAVLGLELLGHLAILRWKVPAQS